MNETQQENTKFAEVFDTLPQTFILLNNELIIEYITPATAKLFSYEQEEVTGQSLKFLLPDQYQDYDNKHEIGHFEGPAHQGNVIEFIGLRKDGYEIPVEVKHNPYVFDNRMLMMCTITDLTESKHYDSQIRRMASCLDSIGEAVCMTDLNGIISYINPAFEKLTGYDKEKLIGNRPKVLRSNRHDQEFYKNMWDTILRGEVFIGQVTNKRKDDTTYEAELTIAPVFDRKNNPIGFVAVQKNISEYISIQKKLNDVKENLQKRNKELESFNAIASHDLKSPLNTITSLCNLLEDLVDTDTDTDTAKEIIKRIDSSSKKMRELIEDLLAFSKMDHAPFEKDPVDLNLILSQTKVQLETVILDTQGQLKIIDELPGIEGNSIQLQQLFTNLIGNALKYHKPDVPPVIKITSRLLKREKQVHIIIEDNGVGFDMKHHQKIFEAFERLHSKHEFEGTGMGLAICKKVIEKHHGNIYVESKPGKGSHFHLILPLKQIKESS